MNSKQKEEVSKMKEVKRTVRFSKIDMVNTSVSESLKDATVDKISVVGLAIGVDVDVETGELRQVGYIKDVNGVIYGTVSQTVIGTLESLADLLEESADNTSYDLVIVKRTSQKGREFLTIRIVE